MKKILAVFITVVMLAGILSTLLIISAADAEELLHGTNKLAAITGDTYDFDANSTEAAKTSKNLTDGDDGSGMVLYNGSKTDTATDMYITYDFGAIYSISYYKVIPNKTTQGWKLEYSNDNQNWTVAHTVASCGWVEEATFSTPFEARYVRVHVTNGLIEGGAFFIQLREFYLTGTYVGETPSSQVSSAPEIPTGPVELLSGTNKLAVASGDTYDFDANSTDAVKTSKILTDGDDGSGMVLYNGSKTDTATNTYFTYDFGNKYAISYYKVIPNKTTQGWKLEYSNDNQNWTVAHTVASCGWVEQATFSTPFEARYVRVHVTNGLIDGGAFFIQLREFYMTGTYVPDVTSSEISSTASSEVSSTTSSTTSSETSSTISSEVSSTTSSETSSTISSEVSSIPEIPTGPVELLHGTNRLATASGDIYDFDPNSTEVAKTSKSLTDGDDGGVGMILYNGSKTDTATNTYFTYDFGHKYAISYYKVIPNKQTHGWKLEYSNDNQNWSVAHTVDSCGWVEEVTFSTPFQARYVRFHVTKGLIEGGNFFIQLREFYMTGTYVSDTTSNTSSVSSSSSSNTPAPTGPIEVLSGKSLIANITGDTYDYNPTSTEDAKTAKNLNDGDIETRMALWSKTKTDTATDTYISYDLGYNYDISYYKIIPHAQGMSWTLQYSLDNQNWKDAHTVDSSGWSEEKNFSAPFKARYVRFHVTNGFIASNEFYIAIREIFMTGEIPKEGSTDTGSVGGGLMVAALAVASGLVVVTKKRKKSV